MSADRAKKIDIEVNNIHTQIKKSNLVLRQRMKDLQAEMEECDSSLDGLLDDNHGGYLPK